MIAVTEGILLLDDAEVRSPLVTTSPTEFQLTEDVVFVIPLGRLEFEKTEETSVCSDPYIFTFRVPVLKVISPPNSGSKVADVIIAPFGTAIPVKRRPPVLLPDPLFVVPP